MRIQIQQSAPPGQIEVIETEPGRQGAADQGVGTGAAAVAEPTGYEPPNKAANELLGEFYTKNPNELSAVKQAGLLRDWIAYPGDNGLAVTQIIYDMIESIVTGESDDMAGLQEEMVVEVSSLLPQ